MKELLLKEFRLVVHPSSYVLAATGALVLVPAWPYAVIFIWMLLPAFFNAMVARENNDYAFSFSLPVSRDRIATSKVLVAAMLQLVMVAFMATCIAVKGFWSNVPNPLGLGANFAYLGIALLVCGVFDMVFYPWHLADPRKVGIPFLVAAIAALAPGFLFEVLSFLPAWSFLAAAPYGSVGAQLAIFAPCVLFYGFAVFAAVKMTRRTFSRFDL